MRISAPLVTQLHLHTRAHRLRLQLRAVLGASQIGAWIGSGTMLCVVLVAQLTMLPNRYSWYAALVGVTTLVWLGVWGGRQRHAPVIWRQLDHAYDWYSSVSTAVDYAHRHAHHPLAHAQYRATLALIDATPARQLAMGWHQLWRGWVVWGVASGLLLALPTPYDAQITAQAEIRRIAQQVADQIRTLPPISTSDAAEQAAHQLAAATDAQQLLAQLDVTDQQLTTNQRQIQTLATVLSALQQTPDAARATQLLASTAAQLPADVRVALADAHARAQTGDDRAFAQLNAALAQQQHTNAAWQRALADAKQQTQRVAQLSNATSANQQANQQANAAAASSQQRSDPQSAAVSGAPQSQSGSVASSAAPNAAGNGSGSSTAANTALISLFVPQLDAIHVMQIPAQAARATGSGDEILTGGGGLAAPVGQYTYPDIVAAASQQAARAIADAQVAWSAQQTVTNYFAVLQEQAP
ncbi:MAG: hypothetical protein ACKO83_04070 [Roseiflexaceae bacterium]